MLQSPEAFAAGGHPELLRRVPILQHMGVFSYVSEDLNLARVVAATQGWVRGDHGFGDPVFDLSPEQEDRLRRDYERLDMVEQRDLVPGTYDDILGFGAIQLGNDKRLKYIGQMLNAGVAPGRITLLGGERSMFPEREPDDLALSIRDAQARCPEDSWLYDAIARFRAAMENHDYDRISETDMLRISALQHLGRLTVAQMHLHLGAEEKSLTRTPITRYDFTWDGPPVSLLHSRARPRKDGAARHTTESCVIDWAQQFNPKEGARVAVIGSQPHLDRMGLTVARALRSIGRGDIELVVGGPGTTEETGHTIYLGEVARYLYELKQLVEMGRVDTGDTRVMRQSVIPGLGSLPVLHQME